MFTHKIYILLVVVFCSACNTIYLPSSQSPNLFEKKKQGMLSVAGFSANTNVKFAYSPKNNFFVSGAVTAPGLLNDPKLLNPKYYDYELGLGYYKKIDDMNHIEFQTGYGIRKFAVADESFQNIYITIYRFPDIGSYKKFNIQSIYTYTPLSKKFNVGIANRLSILNAKYTSRSQYNKPNDFDNPWIVESTVFLKINVSKRFNLYGAAGLCYNFKQIDIPLANPFFLRLGLEAKLFKFKNSSYINKPKN